jgi:Zn-dependent alcohol dehydrogenase
LSGSTTKSPAKGCIGVNAVQGAAHVGAQYVIAVDPLELKRDAALKHGATHAFPTMEEATDLARSFTHGQGADAAVVTIGVTTGQHVAEAIAAIRKGGTVVVTGVGSLTEVGIPISAGELTLYQKRLQGSLFGMCSPSFDIPRQIEMYRSGMLKLDELVTQTYTLDEVAQGFSDLHAGVNIRGVVLFD